MVVEEDMEQICRTTPGFNVELPLAFDARVRLTDPEALPDTVAVQQLPD